MDIFTAVWDRTNGWSSPLPTWDGPNTLVFVFGGTGLLDDDAPLRTVVDAFPRSAMVGCSTSGEILDARVYDDSITLAVARFEHTTLAVETQQVSRSESADAGRTLGKRLRERGDGLAAVFVLGDGLNSNGSTLAQGLTEGTGGSAIITGGLAADGNRFARSWVLVDGRPAMSHVAAVGLYGTALEVASGSCGGWSALGPERVVTRSEGNMLLELDGRPALETYKAYLGERASGLPATALLFPLAIRVPGSADAVLIRTVLSVDEEQQGMSFTDDIPEGAKVQLMRGTSDRIVDAARSAAAQARLPGDEPALAIVVSCNGRRLYLGQRVEDELETVVSELGATYPVVGFYSYGELSPIPDGGCALHNQTITITTLRERPA